MRVQLRPAIHVRRRAAARAHLPTEEENERGAHATKTRGGARCAYYSAYYSAHYSWFYSGYSYYRGGYCCGYCIRGYCHRGYCHRGYCNRSYCNRSYCNRSGHDDYGGHRCE